ncbi:MAG: phosphatase PAP2 family protein, partial [Clostridiales bacterium]|nr:phosphatase PAP2 family protein [Clostridiales bacterium]
MEALSQWEGQFLLFLQDNARGALDGPLSFITRLGDHGLFWIAVTLILLIPPRTRRIGLASMFALLLSLLISNI